MNFILITLIVIQYTPISVATNGNDIQQITHNIYNDTAPIIQVDPQKYIHTIWNGWEIYAPSYPISYMTDKGAGETGIIMDRLVYESYKDLAIDSNGIPHITFRSPNDLGRFDVVYTNLSNGHFNPIENLTYDTNYKWDTKIAIDSNDVIHVIYNAYNGTLFSPFNISYINTSTGWFGTPINVYSNIFPSWDLALAVDSNGKVHLAWKMDFLLFSNIYYTNNTQGSFGPPVDISADDSVNDSKPAIAMDSQDYAHVTWVKGNNPSEIYYTRYNSSDGNFTIPINITGTPTWMETNPSICVDSNDVIHIAYEGTTATDSEIYYLKKSGDSFNSPINLTKNSYDDFNTSITVDSSNNIHLVWETWINNIADIFYTIVGTQIIPEGGGIPCLEWLLLFLGTLIALTAVVVIFWRRKKR